MKSVRKLAFMAGMLALCACASRTGQGTTPGDTTAGGDKAKVDCSTVRCAACPEGQRPALKPPDCCKCIPA
jgi:hypothetical protein